MSDNKKEYTQEELDAINKYNKIKKFAEGSVSYKNPSQKVPSNNFTIGQIQQALENPYNNVSTLQQVSLYLYYNNGVYQRLIDNYAGTPLYDLFLSPTSIIGFNKKLNVDKMNKEYEVIAQLVDKSNYRYNFSWMGKMLLLYGELYVFEVEDNSGLFYKMIPHDLCRISKIQNDNIYKYSINIQKLSDKDLYSTMPVQIQKLYDKYLSGGLDEEKMVQGYYPVEDKEAVAFLCNDGDSRTKGIPLLTFLFDKLLKLDSIESEDLENTAVDNLRLLHQECPINDEGEFKIDEEYLQMYHESAKQQLPKNVGIVTSPLKLDGIILQRQNNQTLSATLKAYENIYMESGVNSELFNGDKNSNEAIINSIKADEIVTKRLPFIFGNYLNYKIKNKKKNSLFKCTMLYNTYYNREATIKLYKDVAMTGTMKFQYLASLGLTPLEQLSTLYYEQAMGMNDLFAPLSSGWNAKSDSGDTGRPSVADGAESDGNVKKSEN